MSMKNQYWSNWANTMVADALGPDSKVPRVNMGPIWGRQDPVGPHVGPVNFAIWGTLHG